MIKYLLLFLLPFSLFASKILSYNIYERTDRADVMITFDTPYHGIIKQSKGKTRIIIKLEDASIESSKIKKVSSNFLHSLTITPMANYTQIVASVPSSVKLIASKTSDAYGLRLRFTDKAGIKNKNTYNQKNGINNSLSSLPTKKDDDLSSSYYIVVIILVVGIMILFFIKRKINTKQENKTENSWLFKKSNINKKNTIQENKNEVSIRFQKSINESNSVVMLDFANQSYLVLMGNSNILLDKFTENKPTNQQEFEAVLQNRHQELEDFLEVNSTKSRPEDESKEPLQAYKERAASLIYGDES
jgi:uncharacterized membrane-anchored protein YhcB (DUF1043 family)